MPNESRILNFEHKELFEALREYCLNAGKPLRGMSVKEVNTLEEGGIRVDLNSGSVQSAVDFSDSEMAAALILFCIKKRIPVPKKASKSLQINDGKLSLRLEMNS